MHFLYPSGFHAAITAAQEHQRCLASIVHFYLWQTCRSRKECFGPIQLPVKHKPNSLSWSFLHQALWLPPELAPDSFPTCYSYSVMSLTAAVFLWVKPRGEGTCSPSCCLFALINEETNWVPTVFLKAVWSWRWVKPLHSLGTDNGVMENRPGSIICCTDFTPQHQHTFRSRSKGKLKD